MIPAITSSAMMPNAPWWRSAQPTGPGLAMSRRRNSTNAASNALGDGCASARSASHWPANSSMTTQPGSPSMRAALTQRKPPNMARSEAAGRAGGQIIIMAAPVSTATSDATVPAAAGTKPTPNPAATRRANVRANVIERDRRCESAPGTPSPLRPARDSNRRQRWRSECSRPVVSSDPQQESAQRGDDRRFRQNWRVADIRHRDYIHVGPHLLHARDGIGQKDIAAFAANQQQRHMRQRAEQRPEVTRGAVQQGGDPGVPAGVIPPVGAALV